MSVSIRQIFFNLLKFVFFTYHINDRMQTLVDIVRFLAPVLRTLRRSYTIVYVSTIGATRGAQ
jgi:hypothetical protein